MFGCSILLNSGTRFYWTRSKMIHIAFAIVLNRKWTPLKGGGRENQSHSRCCLILTCTPGAFVSIRVCDIKNWNHPHYKRIGKFRTIKCIQFRKKKLLQTRTLLVQTNKSNHCIHLSLSTHLLVQLLDHFKSSYQSKNKRMNVLGISL